MTLNERAVATSDDQATIKVPVMRMRMLAFAAQATSKPEPMLRLLSSVLK